MKPTLPPLLAASERLLREVEDVVPTFPKKTRYLLGQDIRGEAVQGLLHAQSALRQRAPGRQIVVVDIVAARRILRGKERKNSERSGIRTRQLCGFFVPGFVPGGRRIQDPQGKEVRRLRSVLNLPASQRARVRTFPLGLSNLTQERFMHQLAIGAAAPIVILHDGAAVTSSLEVARVFGKRHDHVMRDIRNLVAQLPKDRLPNFGETVEMRANPSGGDPIRSPAYLLTRDGFTLLAMGFTGKKALTFKLAYIDAFNRMENELRDPSRIADYRTRAHAAGLAVEREIFNALLKRADGDYPFVKAVVWCDAMRIAGRRPGEDVDAKLLNPGAYTCTLRELARIIALPDGPSVPDEELAALAKVCAERLEKRALNRAEGKALANRSAA